MLTRMAKTAKQFLLFSSVFGILIVLLQLDQTAFAFLRFSKRKLCWCHFLKGGVFKNNDVFKIYYAKYEDEKDDILRDERSLIKGPGDIYKQQSPVFKLKNTRSSVSLRDAAFNAVMDSVVKTYFGEYEEDDSEQDDDLGEILSLPKRSIIFNFKNTKSGVYLKDAAVNAVMDSVVKTYFGEYEESENEKDKTIREERSLFKDLKDVCKQWSPIFKFKDTRRSISLKDTAFNAVMDSVVKAYFGEYGEEIDVKNGIIGKETSPPEGVASPKNVWVDVASENNHSYAEVAVQNQIFDCSLDTFYESFWSNNAKFPLSTYLNEMWNDTDVIITNWEDSGDGSTMRRKVTYKHPTNAVMGPKVVPITKEQVIQKYGAHGMCLSTTTMIIGVPVADSFVIEDRILISSHDRKRTSMTAQFSVHFVKNTLFKKTLEKDSRQGIRDYWETFSKWAPTIIEKF